MTTVEVRIRYYGHDFWLHPTLLGWRRAFERDGAAVEIQLPAGPKEYQASEHEQETEPTPSTFPVATIAEPGWDNETVAVRLFCVVVRFVTELPSERPEHPFEGEYGEIAEAAFDRGSQVAEAVAHDFLRWLRASTRQPWLGLIAESPQQYGRAGLYYSDSGQPILGFGPTVGRSWRSSRLRLEPNELDSMINNLVRGDEIPVATALLADAWHLSAGSTVPDVQRATLIAAIACEVRTKEFMRQNVSDERTALLHMMLDRTSTLTFLLHGVFLAAFDVSLQKANPQLYNRVKVLTKQRNAIVHEGQMPEPVLFPEGAALVASDLFDWLNSCLQDGDVSPSTAEP